jgi:formylglycine-generating enzyme required for sulfatase activity
MFRTLIAALALVLAVALPAAANDKRVALIVGIGDYQHLSRLDNPVPDAKAVSASLKAHGFTVSEHYNLTRADLLDALERFKREAEGAEVALVYYAGHGMEIDGKNVVAPTDMEIECANKTTIRSVSLDQLFAAAGPAPQQIVLLDACRNNPFPQCPTRGANSGSGFRGFSRLSEEDRSLLIANATLSGQLAADGDSGDHSPFAKSLLKNLDEHPRLFLRDVLELTAKDVRVASRGVQVPEITTRGGSPKVCLDAAGCGEPALSLPAEGALNDEVARRETRAILQQLGFIADKSRGGDDAALADAIKRFQAKAGLAADGEITPSLLAVLRATKTQVAALPVTPKPGASVPITSGPLEHEIGSTFSDCDGCPDMVAAPAGRFLMGAAKSEKGHQAAEEPQHAVTVASPLAISKFEITFDDFEACALEGGCNNYRPQDGGWGRGRRPVIYVSHDDAKAYVDWLRQKTGKPYRLMSEAEWEYAARGGTSTPFAGGEKLAPTQANFDASSATTNRKPGSYEGKTVEVGSFPPNPYGLHDMEGNVFEWVEDCWNPTHAGAPADASPRGGDCKRRVAKGGAWYYEAEFARPSARLSFPKGSRLNVVGFRVARPLE